TDTWVIYTSDHKTHKGKAVVQRGEEVLTEIETPPNLPHNYVLWADFDGDNVWVGTSKGLGHAIGHGYYPGLRDGEHNGARNNTE
ncbi:MAG: regulator, partial [Phycisphaerae bacterium]